MMKSNRFGARRHWRAVAAHAIALAVPSFALGGAAFSSGSATWSWDADTNSTLGGKTTFTITPPSSSALPTSPTFQLNRSGSSGSTTATGKGSIGYVANSTTASWTFAGGSGAAQSDPSNTFTGDTITKVRFGGLYDVTSPGFGPTATGYFSLTVAGTAGVNGSTQIAFDMQWRLNGPSGALLRSSISDGTTFLGGGSGMSFSKTWTYCSAFSPTSVSSSDNIWVGGSLTFIADNAGTPSDANPIQFEASAAPPTATLFSLGGFAVDYFDQATWAVPDQPAAGIFAFTEPGALVPAIPNGIGQRARIVDNSNEPRSLLFNQEVTLGALQIDDDDSLRLESSGLEGALFMDVSTGNASIFVGASAGDAAHGIGAPVTLFDSLDVRVESTTPFTGTGSTMSFDDTIVNIGGVVTPMDVNIRGVGAVNYNAANDYNGATNISENGTLRVNANGALGTGSVNVENGLLEINVAQPFATGGVINVGPGGQVRYGTTPVNGVTANIAAGGGFSGNSTALASIIVNGGGPGVNLLAGGFVGHEQFSLDAGDNPQNIGNTPLYIFAISNDFIDSLDPSITVGSATTSPWIGFGNDRLNRTYGFPAADAPSVTIEGNGVLMATAGELTMHAHLQGGPTATTTVRGDGVVALESNFNTYAGTITVAPGATLRVGGLLPAVQSVGVQAGGLLGGDGAIGGTVNVLAGGVIDPGLNYFNNATATLQVNNITFAPGSLLDFEFGVDDEGVTFNDSITVTGSLTLDGELLINQLEGFDGQQTYVLFNYAGAIIDNGLTISPLSQEIDGVAAGLVASVLVIPNPSGPGGVVVLNVPEPATASVLAIAAFALRRRKR